jgi:hypothetical protein
MRDDARTDANEPMIIQALHKLGCQVYRIKLPCDLLVAGGPLASRNLLVEVKMPGKKLTGEQEAFFMRWPGEKVIVHSVSEVVLAVCGEELMR